MTVSYTHLFEEILNAYDWDFCQIQFNYMDTEIQAGIRGYELAKSRNIPMTIMEPVKGGIDVYKRQGCRQR